MPLWRIIIALLFFVFPLAAQVPDLSIFDEDDPLGADYYDASVGRNIEGGILKLGATSRDKMPVSTHASVKGRFCGVIEWDFRRGGSWELHLFRPGFPLFDVSPFQELTFAVNGPSPIPASGLPIIELQDVRGRKISSGGMQLSPAGVDSNPGTWERVTVPLAQFQGDPQFDARRVKHVTFRKEATDRTAHTLWLDDLRFRSSSRLIVTNPPPSPTGLTGRAGDRTLTLHWEPIRGAQVEQYRVYRAAGGGQFEEMKNSPVRTPSIADVRVENGKSYVYHVRAENEAGTGAASAEIMLKPKAFRSDDEFLEYLQATAFDYFWFEANPQNGMVRDRTQPWSAASIAAMGFGLTAIGIGIDHGWITREQGAERVLRTLRALWSSPQGSAESGTSGYKGWYYHFLNYEDGTRFGTSELSSIDTGLVLAGVLDAKQFFDRESDVEQEIRSLAERIFDRVDWKWMLNGGETLAMGWHPEQGFIKARWQGYNEASILYLLGIGAEGPNALEPMHWRNWTRTYDWKTFYGYSFIPFASLFGHQYSACWIDFRGIDDEFTRSKGITYFENSRRATLAQRAYCIENPRNFPGYDANIWGLTACDGPGSDGTHGYIARGAPPAENDDGTIAPTAAGGSLPFAPEECLQALRSMYDRYREKLWCCYGFRDAFNVKEDWWGADVIGIDQGPILIMVENLRSGRVWERMKRSAVLQRGLKRTGFRPVAERNPAFK